MKWISLLLLPVLLLAAALPCHAFTIDDNYIGADPTHNWAHTDVIGDSRYYNIAGMDVKSARSGIRVDIYTSFVAQTSSQMIWNDRTHIGDLFIGTGGWKPNGTAPYSSDSASSTGTQWDYVAVFDSHVPTTNGDQTAGGTVRVYSTSAGSFIKSNLGGLPESGWVYRADQYVQFTPNSDAVAVATGSWGINGNWNNIGGITYGDLWLDFDYSGLAAKGSEWAFRWAMTCANDVIEGKAGVAPVPEPSTLLLVGSALVGAGFLRRRIRG